MRLIDADALTILLHDDIDGLDEEFPNDKQVKPYMCGVRMALSFIDTAPTIDAVPVVRCKDCKYSREDELWHMRWCKGLTVNDEHFCADGKEKQ